jgi:hypothetical protein
MVRMVLLVCAIQLFSPGFSHARTREEIVVLALLGHLPGDKADSEEGSKVVDVQRIDNQTISVEIKISALLNFEWVAGSSRLCLGMRIDG